MATCEMCGDAGDLQKTKVENTVLKLCESCREVGEPVETTTTKAASTSSGPSRSRSRRSGGGDDDLAPDYGDRVKQAREAKEMSMQDLADELKEKTSVIKRVENERLSPDRDLARKFERALDIDLYESVSDVTVETDQSTDDQPTIGDVAEVREKDQ